MHEQAGERAGVRKGIRGREARGGRGRRRKRTTLLHSWGCSRPCRRGICTRPSKPRRRAGHFAWRSNRCRCCRASWCARCAPPWRRGGPPCCRHTATPGQERQWHAEGTSVNGVVGEFELEQLLSMSTEVTQLDKIPACDK